MFDWASLNHAGIVDQHIDTAIMCGRTINCLLGNLLVAHVAA